MKGAWPTRRIGTICPACHVDCVEVTRNGTTFLAHPAGHACARNGFLGNDATCGGRVYLGKTSATMARCTGCGLRASITFWRNGNLANASALGRSPAEASA